MTADAIPIELTILMPCLNEAETVGRCIEKAQIFLRANGVSGEVVVADNGSSDGSPKIAGGLGARVISAAERGYGAVLMSRILEARGKYIIMGDADAQRAFLWGLAIFGDRRQLRAHGGRGDEIDRGNVHARPYQNGRATYSTFSTKPLYSVH